MTGQVTALPKSKANPEMSLFGMLIGAPLIILALPVLPFIALIWAYGKLTQQSERTHDLEQGS